MAGKLGYVSHRRALQPHAIVRNGVGQINLLNEEPRPSGSGFATRQTDSLTLAAPYMRLSTGSQPSPTGPI